MAFNQRSLAYTTRMNDKIGDRVTVKQRTKKKLVIEIELTQGDSFLAEEEVIQANLNVIGMEMTRNQLQTYDTDGATIRIGELTAYSKGSFPAEYQTPYGAITIDRHVYQTSDGGRTMCPLERTAGLCAHSTPKFAKMVANKYSQFSARDAAKDLEENHGRHVSPAFIQDIADAVGTEVEQYLIDGQWRIEPTIDPNRVASIACGLDGAMMPIRYKKWREAMAGTIAFYDEEGQRLETFYVAAAPEYGKEQFVDRFLISIQEAKAFAPHAKTIGLADGARWNWSILTPVCDDVVQDFYHASEYLAQASEAMYPDDIKQSKEWLDDACHRLKHKMGAASRLKHEMEEIHHAMIYRTKRKQTLERCIGYFAQGHSRMKYWKFTKNCLPIGSGVTEAACKVIIKERMCRSGCRWTIEKAAQVLLLRCMAKSGNQWSDFWKRR